MRVVSSHELSLVQGGASAQDLAGTGFSLMMGAGVVEFAYSIGALRAIAFQSLSAGASGVLMGHFAGLMMYGLYCLIENDD